jgi:hypothetical protein
MRTHLQTTVALLGVALASPWAAFASTLEITTDPPGAAVQVDGVAYGPAPLAIPRIAPGTHELKVSAEGHTTRVDLLQVSGSEDLRVHVPLSPAPRIVPAAPRPAPAQPAPAAPPVLPISPPAATLPPPPAAPPAAAPLPPPPPAQVQPAAPLPVSQLPVAWGTQKKSLTLRVDTVPAGAMVQVVGLPQERPSPAVFTGFSPGTVTLRVHAPGFQEKKVAVDLATDSRTLVTLEPATP